MIKTLTFATCLLSMTALTFPALAAEGGTLQLFRFEGRAVDQGL